MANFRPRNMLVTGGAGFIGKNFVRRQLNLDPAVRIVNLDLLTYAGSTEGLLELADTSRLLFVRGDICDRTLVDDLFRKHTIDTVVHFAAESHVDRSITGPGAFVQTNVIGTYTLLESARHYFKEHFDLSPSMCRFHHVSTDEVYGSLGPTDPPFQETTQYAPNSPYSASKAASDHLVRAYLHTYGVPVTTSNCSNNYGPYQNGEKFIPTVIRCCLQGKPIPVYGTGLNVRDWLFVEDHCRAIDLVVKHGSLGETYNIGADNELTNLEIVNLLCSLMDELHPMGGPHNRLISFVKDRLGHDWRYAINSSKIRTELGWGPAENFDTGLRKTVQWYLTEEGKINESARK